MFKFKNVLVTVMAAADSVKYSSEKMSGEYTNLVWDEVSGKTTAVSCYDDEADTATATPKVVITFASTKAGSFVVKAMEKMGAVAVITRK